MTDVTEKPTPADVYEAIRTMNEALGGSLVLAKGRR